MQQLCPGSLPEVKPELWSSVWGQELRFFCCYEMKGRSSTVVDLVDDTAQACFGSVNSRQAMHDPLRKAEFTTCWVFFFSNAPSPDPLSPFRLASPPAPVLEAENALHAVLLSTDSGGRTVSGLTVDARWMAWSRRDQQRLSDHT